MNLLIFALVVHICSAYVPIALRYHESIGVPSATLLRQQEESKAHITRISGGYERIYSPHFGGLIISLASGLTSICGSSLISGTRLVTAAHCWNDGVNEARQFEVVLDSNTLFSGGTRITTSWVIAHEEYNATTIRNDIAIIVIPPVSLGYFIQPIKLPEDLTNSFEGILATVDGFGRTSEWAGISASQELRHAYVNIAGKDLCLKLFGNYFTESMVCTDGKYGRGPCGGDSGGPLSIQYTNGSSDILVGVISYGSSYGCQAGHPTVHTRITSFIDWIKSKL